MSSNQSVFDILKWGQQKLMEAGIEDARLEAEVLLANTMGQSRGEIYINFPLPISEECKSQYRQIIGKRAKRYPLQYITGKQEFMSLDFKVTPSVLIPRQDTEVLVEQVINTVTGINNPRILDLATGSGAIAVSLAKYVSNSEVYASDISGEALEIAKYNAAQNGVHIEFVQGNLFEPFAGYEFDIIVSNPPYIPTNTINELMTEVKSHEPLSALDGGADGLDFYRQIVNQAAPYIKTGGFIALEIGFDQAAEVTQLLAKANNYFNVRLFQDYGGNDRLVIAEVR